MQHDAQPPVIIRPLIHEFPDLLDVEGVHPDQDLAQPVTSAVGHLGIDDRLSYFRGSIHLPVSRNSFVSLNPDEQVVLSSVGDGLPHGETKDDSIYAGNSHKNRTSWLRSCCLS